MAKTKQTVEKKVRGGKLPKPFIHNEVFEKPEMEAEILGPTPDREGRTGRSKAPPGTPIALAHLWTVPLLTGEQEFHMFRKMNFLRFKAQQVVGDGPDSTAERARLLNLATVIRNQIIEANLRLVVSISRKVLAKVYRSTQWYTFKFDENELLGLISDGNISLMRAVDRFDFGRGYKFSTYASYAVKNNFSKSIGAANQEATRSKQSSTEEFFDHRTDRRTSEHQMLDRHSAQKAYVAELLAGLNERDRQVLVMRMFDEMTLEQVGDHFGLTKERVRQIEAKALEKLRKVADENRIEL